MAACKSIEIQLGAVKCWEIQWSVIIYEKLEKHFIVNRINDQFFVISAFLILNV